MFKAIAKTICVLIGFACVGWGMVEADHATAIKVLLGGIGMILGGIYYQIEEIGQFVSRMKILIKVNTDGE